MKNSENDFIEHVLHELKSPITTIRGFAQMLQEYPKLNQERRLDAAKKILHNTLRLEKIIHHLLLLADANHTLQMHPTSLLNLVEKCKEIVLATHPDANIAILCKEPLISAVIDPDLMELVFINLLENAIKYSPKFASIEIRICKERDQIKISIQDHGIGIEPTHLPYIFDRFYAVNKAQSRKLGGAGLGLTLVKIIIERHKGVITASSDFGKGSTFTIVLNTLVD